jgi:hypothetical protein
MKLYQLDIKVTNRPGGNSEANEGTDRWIVGKIRTVATFKLTIEGDDPGADDGEWAVTYPGATYLGRSSGNWRMYRNDDGDNEMWLEDVSRPNVVSYLFRDWPTTAGTLQGILHLPLSLGETGTGSVTPRPERVESIAWRVADRRF